MKRRSLRLARVAITTALYVVLSLAGAELSFGLIQIRFSEALVLLCFFDSDYCYSMSLGCMITNFFSPLGIIDVIFGTIGTVVSVILIRRTPRLYLAWIPPTVSSVFVALEFYISYSEPFFLSLLTIGIGEAIAVGAIGVPLFYMLSRRQEFLALIGADERYYSIIDSIEKKRKKKNNHSTSDDENNDDM